MGEKAVHAEAAGMLKDAREYIERVGWTRGQEKAFTGAVCLHRALKDVDGTKHGAVIDQEARRCVEKMCGVSIPGWNDAAGRTKDDVLTLLQACEHIENELAN